MATPINISVRQFSRIFWEQVMEDTENTFAEKEALAIKLNSLELLRDHAEYNTGSITFSAAWCIFNLTKHLKVKRIIEIGTFIGKSTVSIASAIDCHFNDGEIYTCDFSNSIKLPWDGKTKIHQFQKKSSTDMLKTLDGNFDFCFLDGRLTEEDLPLLDNLINENTIIALDDFEGMEKGVINLINLRRLEKLNNHFLAYPPSENYLKALGLNSYEATAVLLPISLIRFTNQG
jgi:predicted O-methyltransferase YrrM